jgi:streptogramin lyase
MSKICQRKAKFVRISLLLRVFGLCVLGCIFGPVAADDAEQVTEFSLKQVTVVNGAGDPLMGVAVRIALDESQSRFISIFSDEEGHFTDPDHLGQPHTLGIATRGGVEFKARGYGFEALSGSATDHSVRVKMTRAALAPEDLPAAAWMQDWPQTREARITAMHCVQCHQLPGDTTKPFSTGVGGMNSSDARIAGWHGGIKAMKVLSAQVTSRLSRPRFESIGTSWRTGTDAFLSARIEDIIAPFLAEHMPSDFSVAKWIRGVQIEEFRLTPETNSWYREVAYSPKTKTVIGVDLAGDRIYELDPITGERRWIDIPTDAKHTAPHTMNVDADGFIWISLEDINGAGRYDAVKKQWKIFQDIFDGNMISHDFATNAEGLVSLDLKGRIWISVVSHNFVTALDPKTGVSEMFDLPLRFDGTREPTLPYGVVMTSDRKFIWVSQHATDALLKISTETGEVVKNIQFPEGYAPRRMSIDGQDRVWLALSGRSALGLIQNDMLLDQYPLPMAVSYPYNTLWDPVRSRVWVGTSNAGELLEFDPATEKFRRYPLPSHSESYIRQLSRDPVTGDIWTAYASKLGEKAQTAVVRLTPEIR